MQMEGIIATILVRSEVPLGLKYIVANANVKPPRSHRCVLQSKLLRFKEAKIHSINYKISKRTYCSKRTSVITALSSVDTMPAYVA